MSTAAKSIEKFEPREIRRRLGLNQQQFWSKVGVTQSGGSRYESGRNIPKPVKELVRLVFVEEINLAEITKDDQNIIDYLKAQEPETYKTLKKAAKAKLKQAA